MQVVFEVTVPATVEPGPLTFRVQTPLGTTPEGRIVLDPALEVIQDKEPNDSPSSATTFQAPSILAGAITKAGDTDVYKIVVAAGQELSFANTAVLTGSTLQPVLSIVREDGAVEQEYPADAVIRHRFTTAGTYYVKISDFLQSGRETHFYRIRVSPDPLPATKPVMMWAPSQSSADPRVRSAGTNISIRTAQPVKAPAVIEGTSDAPGKAHYYRFSAMKGRPIVLDVYARRADSALDSIIDIYDAKGNPVEIAVARAVLETNLVLRDHPSNSRNFRLASSTNINVGDWLMMGGEIMRLEELNEGPDDDVDVEGFAGQRYSFFGTSGEAHHIDRAVYKVQMHPAGASFSPNGLPLVRLHARNDDGGPMYGSDSYFEFTPPADGEYVVAIRDAAGSGGPNFSYSLAVRPPRPDFQVSVSPRNPNIPAGSSIPLTITAFRTDRFDGPIHVGLENLPKGITATRGVIAPGQTSTTVLLTADADASLTSAVPLTVAASAGETKRYADPNDQLKLISIAKQADLTITSDTRVVEVEPGRTGEVTVAIRRNNGFRGRVPIEVRNLPPRVKVSDVGLNGVLINEDEDRRTFKIEALNVALPIEQTIYVGGRIETRSENPVYAAPTAILLRIKPSSELSASHKPD
jgi:hypothetical protein